MHVPRGVGGTAGYALSVLTPGPLGRPPSYCPLHPHLAAQRSSRSARSSRSCHASTVLIDSTQPRTRPPDRRWSSAAAPFHTRPSWGFVAPWAGPATCAAVALVNGSLFRTRLSSRLWLSAALSSRTNLVRFLPALWSGSACAPPSSSSMAPHSGLARPAVYDCWLRRRFAHAWLSLADPLVRVSVCAILARPTDCGCRLRRHFAAQTWLSLAGLWSGSACDH